MRTNIPVGRSAAYIHIDPTATLRARDERPTLLFDSHSSNADITKAQAIELRDVLNEGIANIEEWERQQATVNEHTDRIEKVVSILHKQFCDTVVPGADLFDIHGKFAEDIVNHLEGQNR